MEQLLQPEGLFLVRFTEWLDLSKCKQKQMSSWNWKNAEYNSST